jgi:hypothetical protein
MPRDVVVDGVTFRIDREMTAEAHPDWRVSEEDMDWSKVFEDTDELPMYCIGCGEVVFEAEITPTAARVGPGAGAGVEQWQAGFVQNVTQQERSGTYADGARISFVLPEGLSPPIRDGEPGELPFSYSGEVLALGTSTVLREEDNPRVDLPRTIDGATLTATHGTDEFVTWLALAKEEPPRKVVLLGRAVWRVDWDATVEEGEFRRTRPTALSVVTVDRNLNTQVTDAPALGDGRTFPDYRTDASINSYSVGEMRDPLGEVTRRWQYDDDDTPEEFSRRALAPETWFS